MPVDNCTDCPDNGKQRMFGSPCQKCAVIKQCERIKNNGYGGETNAEKRDQPAQSKS
jgi:hypothetical protein